MLSLKLAMLAALFLLAARPAAGQSYEFPVEHDHIFRSCRGKLLITPEQIEYQTEQKEHARVWRYTDLRQINVKSPKKLELMSYEDQKWQAGLDRVFAFKLLEGEITSEISAWLVERATRPAVTSVLPAPAGAPAFAVPVKHLHRFGGCLGTLKIYPDRMIYEAQDETEDSRYWRYGDIQNFSHSERFRFEIVGYEDKLGGPKAYNFQLKEELPATAYDYVWARVYPTKFHHRGSFAQPAESRPGVKN